MWSNVGMLELVEVLPRRSVRRAVDWSCELVCDLWDEPVPHRVVDVSDRGLFIETPFPLEAGSEVILELQPPRQKQPIYALGAVRQARLCRRRGERQVTGMGIEFVDLGRRYRRRLRRSVRGLPPPLPKTSPRRPPTELVWIDSLMSWEEELDPSRR